MQFTETLLSSNDENFERLLYDEVRTQVLEVCTPQVFKPTENISSETFGENDFESSKSEYSALERTLFRSFELFIAGKNIKTDDLGECASQLETHLQSLAPSEQGICGRIFQANEPTYCCRDCAVDSTCVLCRGCFFNSAHIKHNYKISTSAGVGYCDCGDPEAWRSDAWCKLHKHAPKDDGIDETSLSRLTGIDDTDVKLKAELENLRRRINSLPRDIVVRTGKLLKPLLKSAVLCLIDLIQGTPRISTEPLSSRFHRESLTTESSAVENNTEKQTVIDLWSTDDCVVDYKMDNENAWDDWPPPLSHIPLVTPNEDASELGQDAWPRTAPKRRSVVDVEARCLAQLERARKYHPRLFTPRPMRTASERTAASRAFLVLLYNNEYHNYEQVIKTLRRVLDCTTQQGTHYAVLVNCDGRAVLQTNLTASQASNLSSILMRTSTSLSTRPINCAAQHADIYSMEVFFTLFIRWLRRFCDKVPSLRPVICHAILGHFRIDTTELNQSDDLLPILFPGEIVESDSFLSYVLERHSLTWRSVRQELLRLIMSVLLKDNFYRCVFAIKFTRSYSSLIQNHIYDDHLIGDSLCGLSCQFYTVISLARQLLEQNNILTRLLSRLTSAFQANSVILPDFYSQTNNQNIPADIQEELVISNLNNDANVTWVSAVLDLLRRLNPFEWGSSTSSHVNNLQISSNVNSINCVLPEPRVLSWQAGNTLARSWFHPFERLFHVIRDVDYILASLTNVRPVLNNDDNNGSITWWTEAARSSYLDYIRQFLLLLSFIQDMNGMQRETQNHVEVELEWASGFYIMSLLISLLGLTVQVASSDYELYNLVLREVRQVFETRIGIMDRRFRLKSLANNNDNNDSSQVNDNSKSNRLNFHSLGVTTEVYVYDVSVYRLSLLQPIPRLLASLYGHGLEMGLNFESLGLLDQGFVNLLIERPLQIFAFCAQCNAKMWLRNGLAVQQSMTNLFSPSMRVELVDRDLQLLQIASCILPPDEFIVRLIHKFHLSNYLKYDVSSKEPGLGRVHSVEMLLRVMLACVTNRSRPSMAYFTRDYYVNNTDCKVQNCLNEILVDTESEIYYPGLIDDVIHILCLKPLSYSELLSVLPYQSTNSLLLKTPAEQSDSTTEHQCEEIGDHEMSTDEIRTSSSLATTTPSSCPINVIPLRPPVLPASISRSANKRAIEHALPKILHKLAVQSSVNNRTVFSIRPEYMAYRFNRFYWGYRHPEQTAAEANVTKCLKKWIIEQNNNDLKNLPIPPPAPRPLRRFGPSTYPGPLNIIQCVTFVRLVKTLLDIAYLHGASTSWWSYSLLDLLLHLITVALYEDEFSGRKTGSYPFLASVACVPDQCESDVELKELARSRHWLKSATFDKSVLGTRLKNNCITSRLLRILNSAHHDDHSDLITWTLDYWNKVVQSMTGEQQSTRKLSSASVEMTNESSSYQLSNSLVKQDRAEKARARRARIMARMSNMQRNFMDSLSQNDTITNEAELMDIDDSEASDSIHQSSTVAALGTGLPSSESLIPTVLRQCALGPTRSLGSAALLLDSTLSRGTDNSSRQNSNELVTCNLCLEEVTEQASNRMVMAAHVCRSSVLSSRGIEWLEGPVTLSVIRRLSIENEIFNSESNSTLVDNHLSHCDKLFSSNENYDNQLVPFLASVSTTAAAACAGSSRMGLRLIPELLSGIRCLESRKDTSTITDLTNTKALGPGLIDQLLDSYGLSDQDTNHSIILDPWHPRPLVSSRDPIAEEGSFFTFCSHPMHATCKTKYARQIKGRVDHLNRSRNSSMLVFELRCPLCKCISTLDLPMLGPIYLDIPSEWLRSRLLPSNDEELNQRQSVSTNNNNFQPLCSWLRNLSRWLDMSSDIYDFILGPLFPFNMTGGHVLAGDRVKHTSLTLNSSLEDYTFSNFGNIISPDTGVNYPYPSTLSATDCTSTSSLSSTSSLVDMDVDSNPPSAKLLAFSENYDVASKLINSIVKRMKCSLIVQDDEHDNNTNNNESGSNKKSSKTTSKSFCDSGTSSSSGVSSSNSSSTLNPLSRQFWTSRRFSRRSADNDNTSTSLSNSDSSNNNHSTISVNTLRNLLPPHSSSPLVATNLFTFVQRLASLCQPKSLDTLIQRPTGRRAVTAETIVNNGPAIVPLPNEINEEEVDDQVVAFVVADTEIQVNLYPNDNVEQTVPGSNIHVLVTQTEYNPSTTTAATASISATSNQTLSRQLSQTVLFDANLCLSEAIERFHLDFMSFYERLRTLGSSIPQTTTVVSRPTATTPTLTISGSSKLQISDRLTKTTEDISHKIIVNSHNSAKYYLERVAQRARNVIWSAACEWRSLRHSVAYTLIGSERTLRLHDCHEHFFNGGLAERRIHGLEHLLRTSFAAHSRHAIVSRGCSLSCDKTGHQYCWSQLKNHPIHWWWWSYCVPFDVVPKSQLKGTLSGCRQNNPPTILDIAESAASVAATEDARFLWRLLLPPLEKYTNNNSVTSDNDRSAQTNQNDSSFMHFMHSSSSHSLNESTTSLLWDVDITFLFISLLHLRPGLEEFNANGCQCTRLAAAADADITFESGAASLGSHLLACDEGRIRHPIGDSHESHLLRLCYTALLVQTLLSWNPGMDCLNYLKKHKLIPNSCTWNDSYTKSTHWNSPYLIEVWRLLRDLSGLSTMNSSISDDNSNVDPQIMVQSLGLFLRANCLPFLRIAAFVMHKITGVDVPNDLQHTHSSSTDSMNEHSLLLAYLGLPQTPSDLLILHTSPESNTFSISPPATAEASSSSSTNSLNSIQPEKLLNISLLSESLWLARLITSWCLTGRQSLSRQIYQSLCSRFAKSTENTLSLTAYELIPSPNIHLPNLIQLPKEYTNLLLLATDMDCHAEGHTHSDLSLCLVCGHLACLFCYGCRQFEQKDDSSLLGSGTTTTISNNNSSNSNNNQEFAVYRMQAHSRRCHSGYSLLLRIHSCRVILLSDQARRITEIPAPYRDSFGETDPDLRRGNPLFLVESEYKRINQLWISHQLASSTSSDLITPSNLQFGLY
ncbi:E3 ubiquitin-protein ligase [Schistosoma japonicum]|nr:E3 ubiquitin-protein ligase [Schistosoma japonicum]